ncbi:hypothetical protein AMAG_08110 [Allomyces macrogynus ATCC 38327]|uniref:Uncharacterized protein n=1 Tax=Allomyces macrogynus (strain ATCC 38327) TaxID=578462 RepID=A0A0L0SKB3_ALLM3|nr:hypothetical protein AMAG_08110 [Allomyces macrogynus ATCC 38327]|eukprot:KNE62936.1 hypothetical protein AMAG_08110 [Allomyces macrogynus ATCC 38327]
MDVAVLPALAADPGSDTPAAKTDPPSLPIPLPADSAPAELDPAQLDTLLDRLHTILNDETADDLPGGWTPLMRALAASPTPPPAPVTALLVAHITSVPADSLLSSRTEYGAAVLHAAAYYGHIDVVRAVLSAIRSFPTAQTTPLVRASAWMPSPLMLASARGDVDMVQVLLDFPGAHVNEQFPLTGWTALGFCCCATAGHPVATAALLLANGADPAIPAWSARAMHDVGEWDPRLLVPSASPVSAAALGESDKLWSGLTDSGPASSSAGGKPDASVSAGTIGWLASTLTSFDLSPRSPSPPSPLSELAASSPTPFTPPSTAVPVPALALVQAARFPARHPFWSAVVRQDPIDLEVVLATSADAAAWSLNATTRSSLDSSGSTAALAGSWRLRTMPWVSAPVEPAAAVVVPPVTTTSRMSRSPTWRSKLSLSATFPSLRRSNTATSPASGSGSGSGSVVSPSSSSPASSSKGAAVVPSATSSGSSPRDALDASNRALLAKFGLGSAP